MVILFIVKVYQILIKMSFLAKKIFSQVTTLILNEYKFHVNFKGMLYFQDSKDYIYPNSIKDKKFIFQLYENLTPTQTYFHNKTQQKQRQIPQPNQQIASLQNEWKQNSKYPFVAEFWGQRNFLSCAIAPIIFSRIIKSSEIEKIQLTEADKEIQFLQFSFGQYSIFDPRQLFIDSSGQLWHPFIKVKSQKQKKDVKIQSNKIMGVFSNELIAQILDQIKFQNGQALLEHKGQKLKIGKKP